MAGFCLGQDPVKYASPVVGSTCNPNDPLLQYGAPTNALLGCNTATFTWVSLNGTSASANSKIRSFGASFSGGGSALTAPTTSAAFVVPYACTISGWNISLDATDTATVKVWKIATGTAIPTVTNLINTSGVSISSGTNVSSSVVTDFTTLAVAAKDIVIIDMTAVGGTAKLLTFTVTCNAS